MTNEARKIRPKYNTKFDSSTNTSNDQSSKRSRRVQREIAGAKERLQAEEQHRSDLAQLRDELGADEFDRRIELVEKMEIFRREAQDEVRLAIACSRRAYIVDGVLFVEGSRQEEFTRRLARFNEVVPDRKISYAACIAETEMKDYLSTPPWRADA